MKYLILTDGRKLAVTGETARFWLCKGTQYRKGSRSIAQVQEKTETKQKKAKEA